MAQQSVLKPDATRADKIAYAASVIGAEKYTQFLRFPTHILFLVHAWTEEGALERAAKICQKISQAGILCSFSKPVQSWGLDSWEIDISVEVGL